MDLLSQLAKYERFFLPICLVTVLLLYGKSFSYEMNLDDHIVMDNNPIIENNNNAIKEVFTTNYIVEDKMAYGYRPMVKLVLGMEHLLFNKNFKVHHIINILLYLLVIVLFGYAFIKVFPEHKWSIYVGFWLFAIHPIHTEVLCSIKNRDEILGLLFAVLSFLCIIQIVFNKKGAGWFVFSLFLMLLGMMSKINTILFIPVFTFFIFLFQGFRKTLPYATIYAVLVLSYLGFLFFGLESYTRPSVLMEVPYINSSNTLEVLNAKFYAIGTHLYKMIVPWKLFSYYGIGTIPVDTNFHLLSIFGFVFLLGLFCLAYWFWKNDYKFGAFTTVFLLSTFILPSNLIISVQGVISERAMFTPSIAMCLLMGGGIAWCLQKANSLRYIGLVCFGLLTSFYIYKSWDRVGAWEDRIKLFAHDIEQGTKSPKVFYMLGDYYLHLYKNESKKEQDLKMAKKHFQSALKLYPNYPSANNNVGLILSRYENNPQGGLIYLQKAVEVNPKFEDANLYLASTYHILGDTANAILYYQKTLEINPNRAKARDNLSILKEP